MDNQEGPEEPDQGQLDAGSLAQWDEDDPVDQLILELRAAGRSHEVIASALEISSKTVQRHSRRVGFNEALSQRHGERRTEAAGRLGDALAEAVDTMRSELRAERSADRLRAASLIVDSLWKFLSAVEIDKSLAELRAEVGALRNVIGRT